MWAVIPARAASVRLPGKNRMRCAGVPLIEWTVRAARAASCITSILITTDDTAILEAYAPGPDVSGPDLRLLSRPPGLARPETSIRCVLLHALEQVPALRAEPAFCLLQPTSPLRTAADIEAAWKLFEEKKPDQLWSATLTKPRAWHYAFGSDGFLEIPDPDLAEAGASGGTGTGDTGGEADKNESPSWAVVNGALYIYATAQFLTGRPPRRVAAYFMPPGRSVDIDTPEDFTMAEQLLAGRAQQQSL